MQDGANIVCIEVPLRKSKLFGSAEEIITASKQPKIVISAEYYLFQYGNQTFRFDAILMDKANAKSIT